MRFLLDTVTLSELRKRRLATRNTGDFEGAGIALVNPWNER